MGTVISQTKYEILEPGMYHVRVGAVAVEDGTYGQQAALRFDLLDEEVDGQSIAGRCIKAWAKAKLSGGKRPSKLYAWTSALLFAGKPLPEGYDLDTDALLGREALAVVDVEEKDGASYNRIAQLLPLRPARGQGSGVRGQEAGVRRQGPGPAAEAAFAGGRMDDEDLPF